MRKLQPAYPKRLDFEQVWARFDRIEAIVEKVTRQQEETSQQMKETDRQIKETDKQMKETAERMKETDKQMKETDRRMKETAERMKETDKQMKETDRRMKETDKRVGALTGRFGEIVEYMIVPNLVAKFRELGFEFTRAGPDVKIADKEHNIHVEVDAFLENGDKVMIVEIKSKPNSDDVNEHIERMEKLRKYADLKGDSRVYLGAIAGVVFGESEKTCALKNGFYVIEPSGDTFTIIEPKGRYHPREW